MVVGFGGVGDGGVGDDGGGPEGHGEGEAQHDGFADDREGDGVVTAAGGMVEALGRGWVVSLWGGHFVDRKAKFGGGCVET